MSTILVTPTIAPYEGGFALRITSTDDAARAWWKWYDQEMYAFIEAVQLGLATEEVIGAERHSVTVRKTLKTQVSINPEQLERFAFKAAL